MIVRPASLRAAIRPGVAEREYRCLRPNGRRWPVRAVFHGLDVRPYPLQAKPEFGIRVREKVPHSGIGGGDILRPSRLRAGQRACCVDRRNVHIAEHMTPFTRIDRELDGRGRLMPAGLALRRGIRR